ncbi:hypothetical protein Syun_023023 [Stephania yunnanensis]|uniref:Uncharacterized protein n=1 Tax=Stephania yunnanensis TaxID=152371 RepID=A0AAP0FGF8_9MAGN
MSRNGEGRPRRAGLAAQRPLPRGAAPATQPALPPPHAGLAARAQLRCCSRAGPCRAPQPLPRREGGGHARVAVVAQGGAGRAMRGVVAQAAEVLSGRIWSSRRCSDRRRAGAMTRQWWWRGSPVTMRRANQRCRGEDGNGFGGRRRRENGWDKPFRN